MSDQTQHPTDPAEGPRDEADDGAEETERRTGAAHEDPSYGTDSDNPLAAVDDDD